MAAKKVSRTLYGYIICTIRITNLISNANKMCNSRRHVDRKNIVNVATSKII